ncbi:MAG: SIS domain-containing protein [Acidimicrobiales bacterium]
MTPASDPAADEAPVDDATAVATRAIRHGLAARHPHGDPLLDDGQVATLAWWATTVVASLRAGGTLFTFGNGGSAADAEHLAAELVGRFDGDRRPLAAVPLTASSAAMSAIANDYGFEEVFARQVHGLARAGDVVLGISTSGRSPNVLAGLAAASDVGAAALALLGADAPTPPGVSTLLVAPAHTPEVQEAHRAVWHLLCAAVDAALDAPAPGPATTRAGAPPAAGDGVVPIEVAVQIVAGWRRAGRRIATTNGCFDLLHPGHLAALDEARRQADHLVVLCNSDASVSRSKGPGRPLLGFDQRAAVLAGLASVDLVVALDADEPSALLEQLRPDVHVKGADYTLEQLVEAPTVLDAGGRIHLAGLVDGLSTTSIADDLARREGP